MNTLQILEECRRAKGALALLTTGQKNRALLAMADAIETHCAAILQANTEDMAEARGKISDVMCDRLALSKERVAAMAEGVRAVAALPDPVGNVLEEFTRGDGLIISKISVPLGVVAIIYESRPNVTSDAAALCIKSGNVCVLRTGKEAHRSAAAIVGAMRRGLLSAGVNPASIGFIEDTSRESANRIMRANGYIDLLIPRGGAGLISACVQNATVPCIETGTGVCHIYVDGGADFSKALNILENAKCSRPSVCNAAEACLVDGAAAEKFLPLMYKRLISDRAQNPVELYLDERAFNILCPGGQNKKGCRQAQDTHFDTEFLDYKLAVKVVDGVDGAISHIAEHSTHHSDCIVTENKAAADKFVAAVDSAAVYVNASTRFTDGGEFGLGCEMGISTQKLHARGPMGLKELTTYKYVVKGNGNIR